MLILEHITGLVFKVGFDQPAIVCVCVCVCVYVYVYVYVLLCECVYVYEVQEVFRKRYLTQLIFAF